MSTPRKSIRSSNAAFSSAVIASSNTAKTSPAKRTDMPTKSPHVNGNATELDIKAPPTPPRKGTPLANLSVSNYANIVTPVTSLALALEKKSLKDATPATAKPKARRSLIMPTPEKSAKREGNEENKENAVAAKKKLPFGNRTKPIVIPSNVRRVYHIVQKHTGSIGGNGHGGAIYGELTVGSMQKMTNLMIEHASLSKESRFIDVGCGLGKPNLHVAQYPGVEFSYGIEMERVRWMLGMVNLDQVLKAAKKDEMDDSEDSKERDSKIGHRCYLAHGDITQANAFDPFTHVYMFDIGFPPSLFHKLAEMFNRSQSKYLICYHGPKLMVDEYGFKIKLVVQVPTSMHGSAEGHAGYIYCRSEDCKKSSSDPKNDKFSIPCDPLFAKAWEMTRASLDKVHDHTAKEVEKHMGVTKKRVTRSASRKSCLSKEQKNI